MNARLTLRHGLRASSSHWCSRTLLELVSASVDEDLAGIGASPVPGDFSTTGVRVPAAPTVDQSHRYLIRLCGLEIPSGAGLVIRGLRLLATLRVEFARTAEAPPHAAMGSFVFEREITSPLWHFSDGDVSFHLRRTQQVQSARSTFDPFQLPGTSPNMFGVDTSLMYTPSGASIFSVPYVPLGGGIPPGRALDPSLDTIRDAGRYPWTNTDWSLSVPVVGPGVVTLWASVRQTDPAHRIVPPVLTVPGPFTDPVVGGLRPEDQFLIQFPSAIYGRVSGALLVDLFPCCSDMREESRDACG